MKHKYKVEIRPIVAHSFWSRFHWVWEVTREREACTHPVYLFGGRARTRNGARRAARKAVKQERERNRLRRLAKSLEESYEIELEALANGQPDSEVDVDEPLPDTDDR